MLIKVEEAKQDRRARWEFPTPVVGSTADSSQPTSANVNLYAEPATYRTNKPMLYADCEGLDAGETTPMAITLRDRAKAAMSERVHKVSRGRYREIKWATSEGMRTREFAVTMLYPRVLYTFSDVVVFVLPNSR